MLRAYGICAVTLSVHSLDRHRYTALTGGDLSRPLGYLDDLLVSGMSCRVNCVLLRRSLEDALGVAALAETRPVRVRFLELYPAGLARSGFAQDFIAIEAAARVMADRFKGLSALPGLDGQPRPRYSLPNWAGSIEFVSCFEPRVLRVSTNGIGQIATFGQTRVDFSSAARAGDVEVALAALWQEWLALNVYLSSLSVR